MVGKIDQGLAVYVGIEKNDDNSDLDSIGTTSENFFSGPLVINNDDDEMDQLGRLSMNQLLLNEIDLSIPSEALKDEKSDDEDEDLLTLTGGSNNKDSCPIKQEAMRGMEVLRTIRVDELDKKNNKSVVFNEEENKYHTYNVSKGRTGHQ